MGNNLLNKIVDGSARFDQHHHLAGTFEVTAHLCDAVASDEVFTCTADSTVAELMIMMTEHRIRHVPVVDAEGSLLSIVSIGDVVKSSVSEIDSERTALRDYVTGGN